MSITIESFKSSKKEAEFLERKFKKIKIFYEILIDLSSDALFLNDLSLYEDIGFELTGKFVPVACFKGDNTTEKKHILDRYKDVIGILKEKGIELEIILFNPESFHFKSYLVI